MDAINTNLPIVSPERMPCVFSICGCKDQTMWYDNWLSVQVCPYRILSCPICAWKGPSNRFEEHISTCYNKDLEYISLFMYYRGLRIIKSNCEFYVLNYSYSRTSGIVMFSLRFIGPLLYSIRRYFKLFVKGCSEESFEFRQQIGDATTWDFNPFYTVEVNLLNLKLENRNQLEVGVAIEERIPIFTEDNRVYVLKDLLCGICKKSVQGPMFQQENGRCSSVCDECNKNKQNINTIRNYAIEYISNNLGKEKEFNAEVLFKGLECPICLEYMSPPIKNCLSGHSFCGFCRSLLNKCPLCKAEFSCIRNFNLESVYGRMNYKCIYFDNGCTYTNLPDNLHLHEQKCKYIFGKNIKTTHVTFCKSKYTR